MELSPSLKADVDTLMGLGESGTVYLKFRTLLIDLQQKAEAGDPAAKELINIVQRAARLVEWANNNIK